MNQIYIDNNLCILTALIRTTDTYHSLEDCLFPMLPIDTPGYP